MEILENNKPMDAACFKEEAAWSVDDHQRKIEEEKNLKLIKCLRGRLYAERQTTRAANEEAQLMTQKMVELEKKLMQEMEFRDRAENRLNKLLKQKLTLLKPDQTPISDALSSSPSSYSCTVSSSSTSSIPEDEKKPENQRDSDSRQGEEKRFDSFIYVHGSPC